MMLALVWSVVSVRPTMGMALPSDIFNSGTFRSKPAILPWEREIEKMEEVRRD
jgi:hypothetical protein